MNDRDRGVARVLVATGIANVAVASAKIAYGWVANSLAVRADGFHSLMDATNNVLGIVAVVLASRPADRNHPYGHRKFEVLASLLVGTSLVGVVLDVVRGALARLAGGAAETPEPRPAVFVLLATTLLVNVMITAYERREGRRLRSTFLLADAQHTLSDSLATIGVIVAMVLVRAGHPSLDAVAALVVAGIIGLAGFTIVRRAFRILADEAQVDSDRVCALALAVSGVTAAHRIRSRGTPGAVHVDLHVHVDRDLGIVEAHRITHEVMDAIKAGFPDVVDVVVHTEPGPA